MMKFLCIFPHPDDESFAVAGTIKLLTKLGHAVELTVLTDAASGTMHPDIYRDGVERKSPGDIRFEELKNATSILGITKLLQLHYHDGHITNDDFYSDRLVRDIKTIITENNPDVVITYDLTGASWHADHILTSLSTLKACDEVKPKVKAAILFTMYRNHPPRFDYLYKVPYMATHEVDISSVAALKKEAIMAHKSQKHDWLRFMKRNKEAFEKEQFIVKTYTQEFVLPEIFLKSE